MLTVLAYIFGYLIIPYIMYNINDYFAGYFHDRLDIGLSILEDMSDCDIFIIFVFWPFIFIFLAAIWAWNVGVKVLPGINRNAYNKGKAKRKQELDLDYQAEKFLLGKK